MDCFCRRRGEDAFYKLYTHYHDYFTYLGLRKNVNSVKVKDCINDLFLYLFEKREKLVNVADHHNYLVTAFVRKLFKKEHLSIAEELEALNLSDVPFLPSVETEFIVQNTKTHISALLKKHIDRLSHSQAQMIYQKFYIGLSYEEISISNGISVKTAYNTIYNAVEKLKKVVGKEYLEALLAITLLGLTFIF
ncbi:sigma-70 family RNA polymerase sigma factor [Pedobacter sp. BS3]|uniref:RNA polymerase sigma factor n=1 Tax=Pedobacter sp. BS3 TaxID=2567937 RepID=UPI0011F04979|nr:sigma-70 family RNA polymerase sigma factor [Pedobacter sp. BS3]TZF84555.1 sigma-70 family RNA polymerase sigma factor [Pedobacter sp. BS3]